MTKTALNPKQAVKARGRPSKLTPEQWSEIGKRVVVGGESMSALGREFGVSQCNISNRFSNSGEDITKAAVNMAAAQDQMAVMTVDEVECVWTLTDQLRTVSGNLATAAVFGSKTAKRLAEIAHGQLRHVGDTQALLTDGQIDVLKIVAGVTKMSSDSSKNRFFCHNISNIAKPKWRKRRCWNN